MIVVNAEKLANKIDALKYDVHFSRVIVNAPNKAQAVEDWLDVVKDYVLRTQFLAKNL